MDIEDLKESLMHEEGWITGNENRLKLAILLAVCLLILLM